MIEQEGYYKIYYQDWWEEEESKTGWEGSGWGEEKDFELVEYLEEDKFSNPTKALFRYEGAVFLGMQHAAYNVQAKFLGEFMEYIKKYHEKTFEEIYKEEPEFEKLNITIDMIEKRFKIRNYLGYEN